jgi:hypothetical protein
MFLKQKIEDLITKLKVSQVDKKALYDTLFHFMQSELFTDNEQLAITDNIIAKLNSKNGISIKKTKAAISLLEDKEVIEIMTKRPKRHRLLVNLTTNS